MIDLSLFYSAFDTMRKGSRHQMWVSRTLFILSHGLLGQSSLSSLAALTHRYLVALLRVTGCTKGVRLNERARWGSQRFKIGIKTAPPPHRVVLCPALEHFTLNKTPSVSTRTLNDGLQMTSNAFESFSELPFDLRRLIVSRQLAI